jgi:dihydroneopterin aldolase
VTADHRDRIRLTGLRVRGFHGVLPAERRDGQDFLVDVALTLDLTPAATTDDPVLLIETLAVRLADVCLADRRVSSAEVTVHKPSAPIAVPFADVSVTVVRP